MPDRNNWPVRSALMLLFASLLTASLVQAQSTPEGAPATAEALQHGLYLESDGLGGVFSLNLERCFGRHLNARLGLAYDQRWGSDVLIPFGVSFIIARDKLVPHSRLELGLGGAFWPGGEGVRHLARSAMVVAWRQQFGEGHWFYRVSYHSEQEKLWPALSLGRGF